MSDTATPVSGTDETCWTMIRAAADGDATARARFSRIYREPVLGYLRARWRSPALLQELDDALQEVLLECLKDGGALERADPDRPGGFAAFLRGVVRSVARRIEERRQRPGAAGAAAPVDPDELAADDETPSRIFDRNWAISLLREAAARQRQAAREVGPEAERRVEILRLRFECDLPIREIAAQLGEDVARVHHEYARARREFHEALLEVVAFHHGGTPAEVRRECERLVGHVT